MKYPLISLTTSDSLMVLRIGIRTRVTVIELGRFVIFKYITMRYRHLVVFFSQELGGIVTTEPRLYARSNQELFDGLISQIQEVIIPN